MPNHEELWPKSRSRSKATSTASVISCETLSKVDWYTRNSHKAQLYYHSDTDEEGDAYGKAVSEADDDDDEHGGDYLKKDVLPHGGEQKEKLHDAGRPHGRYAESSFDHGHPLPAPFPPPSVYDKPSIPTSRDPKKADRAPRTYNSGIPHSGSILPPSGILLPNYMNIHHAGHNSNSHAHNKGLSSIKAAALIPSHTAGKSSKGRRAFNDVIEPSSPKVTCLGRVKIKHKCRREMGNTSELPAKKGINKGLANPQQEGGQLHNGGRTTAADLSSAPAMSELKKFKHGSHRDDAMDPASDSEVKNKKSICKALKEAKSHMKIHRERKQSSSPNAVLASTCAASHVEIAIDLGRFRSIRSIQGQESNLQKTLGTLPAGDYDSYDSGFTSQVPPPNSLLLMRNSKSRAMCATLNSSLSRKIDESHVCEEVFDGEPNVSSREAYLSLLKGQGSVHNSTSLLEVNFGELEIGDMLNGCDEQGAYLQDFNVERLCAMVADEYKLLHGKKNAMAHRQASLPRQTAKHTLWQRRCIMKPSDLDVGRPIALQVCVALLRGPNIFMINSSWCPSRGTSAPAFAEDACKQPIQDKHALRAWNFRNVDSITVPCS